MIRESDEECFLLIAVIRARFTKERPGKEGLLMQRSEVERLLGNLEARIDEAREAKANPPLYQY